MSELISPDAPASAIASTRSKPRVYLFSRLPFPCSENEMYVNRRRKGQKGRMCSPELLTFKKRMEWWRMEHLQLVNQARLDLRDAPALRICAWFHYHPSRIFTLKKLPKKQDVTNRVKPLHDSLMEMLGLDDCLIFDAQQHKCAAALSVASEWVDVRIEVMQDPWKSLMGV
jgi:hypothetical protein